MRYAPLLLIAAHVSHAALPWQLLIGPDLNNWTQRNGVATYRVEDQRIIGRTVPGTPNSFLCTPRDYGDFILEYELKVDPRLNSGVQIRSAAHPTETSFTNPDGKAGTIPAGRVHGYQMEIDNDPKKDRWWTAGLYEEARRGWLYPGLAGGDGKAFTEQGRRITRADDWNRVRVTAIGPRIRSWLNDEPRVDALDEATAQGFIALQVHGVGKDPALGGLEVQWRDIRVMPLGGGTAEPNTLSAIEEAQGWTLLWDGAGGRGWRGAKQEGLPPQGWTVEDGALTVRKGGGDLLTTETYGNFILKLEFRLTEGANSGIKYRVDSQGGTSIGMEYQLLDDARHPDAKNGRDGNRTLASLYDVWTAQNKRPRDIGAWNQAMIIADGTRIEHWLNGDLVLAFDTASPAFAEARAASKFKKVADFGVRPAGPILLQDHGDPVSFRNIKIRRLD